MGLVVKALVLALLTLPVMAYVTGSMVGARSELPAQRDPVVIGNRMDVAPPQTIRSESPGRDDPDDRDDGPGDRDGDGDDPDDTDVSVVRPQPREIDDDADERDDGPDDDSGDSGDDSGDDDD